MHEAVADLRGWIELGLERGGALLTAGERVVLDRMVALEGEPALLHARLTARVHGVFCVEELGGPGIDDPTGAVEVLRTAGLVDDAVPFPLEAAVAPRRVLAEGCRVLGLPRSGKRGALAERLAARHGWDDRPWIRVRHRALVQRLIRWATLRAWPDRSAAVVERLGLVRWPTYELTDGAVVAPDRESWLRWEALVARWERLSVTDCLDALAWPSMPGGRLNLRGALVRRLTELARELERAGEPAAAAALGAVLVDRGHVTPARVAVRRALALEAAGATEAGWAVLRAAGGAGPERLGIARTGRRLAKRARRAWPPDPPVQAPRERRLLLKPAPSDGPRPLWHTPEGARPVEAAVSAVVEGAGRRVVQAEGPLWATLFALLFAEVYFLPVPGQLPVRRLAGPLDLRGPEFAERRRGPVDAVLAGVAAGEGPSRAAAAFERWQGVRLSGARWLWPVQDLVAVIEGAGPAVVVRILETMLTRGRRATRGLPDLIVLQGDPVALDSRPAKLGPGLVFAEVKGPGDTIRDEQRWWFGELATAGAAVELWRVSGA